jgi:uncharacterized membrane protein YfcA
MKNVTFLKWWVLFVASVVGLVFCWQAGLIREIYQKDSSFISFIILGIYLGMSMWCGITTRTVCKIQDSGKWNEDSEKNASRLAEGGWFISEVLLTLGMLGTVIGFVMMLAGFEKVDVTQMGTVQNFIGSFGQGMSTALYTTLVGIVCSMLLKLQYFNLSDSITRGAKS